MEFAAGMRTDMQARAAKRKGALPGLLIGSPMNDESIFAEAIAKAAPERPSYLEAVCRGDADLRDRVEALLRAHDNPDPFLEGPSPEPAPTIEAPVTIGHAAAIIGPYKLLQQIGEGGMGTVYMAEQMRPMQRKVALKVIKPG